MNPRMHYQIAKHTAESGEVWYGLYRYYLCENGEWHFARAADVEGDTVEEIRQDLRAMERSIDIYGVKDYDG